MKLKLTIDNQPLILELEAIVALFGKSRTLEFAAGRWSPYVFVELAEPVETTVVHVPDLTVEKLNTLKNEIPYFLDFDVFIRDKIDEIEKKMGDAQA